MCPPFPFLQMAEEALAGEPGSVGAQNVSTEESGAYTGEVSAAMLTDFGCRYVICGHSERRALYGEDDAIIAEKMAAARGKGLTPILCVGETLQERERGETDKVIADQLDGIVNLRGIEAFGVMSCLRAGLGHRYRHDRDARAGSGGARLHPRSGLPGKSRRSRIRCGILYGGSMKPEQCPRAHGAAGHRRRPDRRGIAQGRRVSGDRRAGDEATA